MTPYLKPEIHFPNHLFEVSILQFPGCRFHYISGFKQDRLHKKGFPSHIRNVFQSPTKKLIGARWWGKISHMITSPLLPQKNKYPPWNSQGVYIWKWMVGRRFVSCWVSAYFQHLLLLVSGRVSKALMLLGGACHFFISNFLEKISFGMNSPC